MVQLQRSTKRGTRYGLLSVDGSRGKIFAWTECAKVPNGSDKFSADRVLKKKERERERAKIIFLFTVKSNFPPK